MATKNSTTQRGRYLTKVGYLDLYQKITLPAKKGEKGGPTTVGIYHGKTLIEKGELGKEFKTLDAAIEKAQELVKNGVTKKNK